METIHSRRPDVIDVDEVPQVRGAEAIARDHADMLSDESRLSGRAEWLFFPENEAHVASVLSWAQEERVPLAVSGGRTGIVGGAVPEGGAVLSLERMKRIGDASQPGEFTLIEVQPGVTIEELASALRKGHGDLPGGMYFYPPDPTETTAQIGGTIANNASGARTFRYGPTRMWVEAMDVALPDGDIVTVERGNERFDDSGRLAVETSRGKVLLELPPRPVLQVRKDVAGYYLNPGMELMDLFIGSEGTLGIVTRAVLRLEASPEGRVAVMLFPEEEAAALKAVRMLREGYEDLMPESIEFFDANSLDLLHQTREEAGPGGEIPPFPHPSGGAVSTEFPFQDETEIDELFERVLMLVEEIALDEDRTWVATDEDELQKMKSFRHILPETINSIIGRRKAEVPELRKVGTDLAVPVPKLEQFLAHHHELLRASGLEYAVWGHFGDAHLHCNMLPHNAEDLGKALELYETLARRSVSMGGTVAAEHGIGRLKKKFLPIMLPEDTLAGMKLIKRALDPAGVLSPGVLF